MAGDCGACQREKTKEVAGRRVCTWCEAWRAECEARYVCGLPDIRQRRGYLGKVVQARGQKAGDALMRRVKVLWEAGEAAAP